MPITRCGPISLTLDAASGHVVAEHPRQGLERIVIDPRHYEGEATDDVLPPLRLGRMSRRLQELMRLTPQQRPLDPLRGAGGGGAMKPRAATHPPMNIDAHGPHPRAQGAGAGTA